MIRLLGFIVLWLGLSVGSDDAGEVPGNTYLSPTHIVCDQEAGKAYVSLSTAGRIAVVNTNTRDTDRYIELPFDPEGLALDRGRDVLYVTEKKPEGLLHCISLSKAKCVKCIKLQHTPGDVVLAPDSRLIFVANRFSNSISVIDPDKKTVVGNIRASREPIALDISRDGSMLAVANYLPAGAATDDLVSAEVSLVDVRTLKVVRQVQLIHGSHSLTDIKFSADGKFVYVTHVLSRNQVPATQLDHGWLNTNVLSIVDAETGQYCNTVLLDDFDRGAANPAGMGLSEDGNFLWVALSGVHELCKINLSALHARLTQAVTDRKAYENVPNDFRFLHGIKERVPLRGRSPRHVAVSGGQIFVSAYFSPFLDLVETSEEDLTSSIVALGMEPAMDSERRGALNFADANLCFQQWQSCVSCHPDGRSDALNWDLLNDGVGNPKNSKSMLYAHKTPPAMITGIRDNAAVAVRAGIRHILFAMRPETDAADIDAYLVALDPVPSPYLIRERLSADARKGRDIFRKAGCASCHSGPYYTDGKKHDVATGTNGHAGTRFDTPSLTEVWRTAPYLYDGRAKTIEEVLTVYNRGQKHGVTGDLSEKEISQLEAYVLSL